MAAARPGSGCLDGELLQPYPERAFTILLVGSARGISAVGAQGLARGILWLDVLVALVGIIQKAVGSEALYGFWYPPKGGGPFAPFINANHFAGWMVLAMSLSIGYFAGGVARGLRGVKRDWRHRVLWLSSSEANETLLTGFAVVVMALSMVLHPASRPASPRLNASGDTKRIGVLRAAKTAEILGKIPEFFS